MEITVLKAICAELKDALTGAKLVELAEGEAGLVCMTFKGGGKRPVLTMSPRPDMPRVYLTRLKTCKSNTLNPFAQSLRNHIIGATLSSVRQEGLERVIFLQFTRTARDSEEKTTLAVEFAGKKPNIILSDSEGTVLLAQSYVSLGEEALRPILPGLKYMPPPKPDRLDPFSLKAEDIERIFSDNSGIKTEKALLMGVNGLSPLIASEAVYRSGTPVGPQKIIASLNALLDLAGNGPYEPCIYQTSKGPVLSAISLGQFGDCKNTVYKTMCEAAEVYYGKLVEGRRFSEARASAIKSTSVKLVSAKRKLKAIEEDLARADNAEAYQRYGQILMASLPLVPKEVESATLPDLFTDNGGEVTIPLDSKLTPVQNAEGWFKKAKKAKAGVFILTARLLEAGKDVNRLERLLGLAKEACVMEELQALDGTPVKRGPSGIPGKPGKGALPEFPHFKSSDGYEIYYAKNAKANDIITFKFAEPMDLWLHAQGYHGGHVIVRNPDRRPDIPLQTILEAAEVAAWFSEARDEKSVPVDYAFKKYVRKPRDPAPGQAIFTGGKTVFVEGKKPGEGV